MRLSHIENRLEQQLLLKDLIINSFENLTKVGYANITPQRVNTRISDLKDNWKKFSIIHDAITLSMTKLNEEDKLQLQQHSYFNDHLFVSTHESYLEAFEKMSSCLDTNSDITTDTPVTQSLSQNSSIPVYFHHARLPRIDIPKFNSSPSEWLSFKDLFNSLIIANPSLSSVEKLQYLKTSLIGSAGHLLKNTALTADNFQKAWEALISFYENKRLLVNAALLSLLTLKRMTKESAAEMESLYTSIMEIYRTLETLGRPVHHWDDVLVFVAVDRLDSESVKAWEYELGSVKEPPTWKQFSDFLITRLITLKAFEKSRRGKSTPYQNSAKSYFQGKTKESTSNKSISCSLCSSNHYITKCPQYNSKSVQQRLSIITKNKLCFNCLGAHRASACRVTKRCLKCGHKHHTTIHQTNSKSSNSDSVSSAPEKSTETQVLHSSINQTTKTSCIFLATARVLIVSATGESLEARALIDQGSEISLISEKMAHLLRLPRSHSSISLIGIGAQRSSKTRGVINATLKSLTNTQAECTLSLHILPKLTSSLPSIQTTKQDWPHLRELPLADCYYSSSGPIDIILGADVYPQIIENGIQKGDANSPVAQRTIFGWIISGPSGVSTSSNIKRGYHISADKDLHDLLQRFWKLDEIPSSTTSSLSIDEQECERHFKETHSRDCEGKYVARLPFKKSAEKLGDSHSKALRMMTNLSKKLASDSAYEQAYSEFLEEYERLRHMKRIPETQPEPQYTYYLPHHGVM